MAQENNNHHTWRLLGGAALFILGIIAFYGAAITSFALIYTLGWVLVIGGVVGFVLSFAIRGGGLILGLISAVLSFVMGGIMIANPAISLATLSFLLALFFIIDGAMRIIFSFTGNTDNAGWSIVYGIVALLLGGSIWAHLPTSSLYIFGIFIGLGLLFKGITVIATSVTPAHLHRPHTA